MHGTLPVLIALVYDSQSSSNVSPVINLLLSDLGLTFLNILARKASIYAVNSGLI